jgi:hypothetical protein
MCKTARQEVSERAQGRSTPLLCAGIAAAAMPVCGRRPVRLRNMRRAPKAVERGVVPLVENVVTRALDYALAGCSNPSGQNDPVLFLRGRWL